MYMYVDVIIINKQTIPNLRQSEREGEERMERERG